MCATALKTPIYGHSRRRNSIVCGCETIAPEGFKKFHTRKRKQSACIHLVKLGEILLTIMASIAQQESESLSQNVKLGYQLRYQSGKVSVNHNRFMGYTKDKDGKLVIVPDEAKVIRRIFREFLEGRSLREICNGLEADEILTGAGMKKWRPETVHKMLQNEKYIGDALLQKTYTVDFLNKKRIKNDGIMPQYYVENSHEGIIPRDLFMQVQEELLRRSNNIYVTAGFLWHHATPEGIEQLKELLPDGMGDKPYPMKSYFDYGIDVSTHSDFPATSGSPYDPFGIMEIAVTGVYDPETEAPLWTEELLTREQALTALTINCAKQMYIENERGSIGEGKYADFILVDKDVLTCPETEIHIAQVEATYFEGENVYNAS